MWYLTFITINLGHAAYLLYEGNLVKLTAAERRVCDIAFPSLIPFRSNGSSDPATGLISHQSKCLTRQGKISEYLYLIAEDEASIRVREQEVTSLRTGRFVGEVAFLACCAATAIASSADEQQACRCLAWEEEKLRHRLARDPALKSVM